MEFALGVILFLIGTGLIALCLFAIPGPQQDGASAAASSAHHHPGAH